MRWVDQFLDRLDESVEWQTVGSVAWRFFPDEGWLQAAPCPLEVDEANDDMPIFTFFGLDVSHLIEIFDEQPAILWSGIYGNMSLDGKIGGSNARITLWESPFETDGPQDINWTGGIRIQKPSAEL